jgi:uncharacterized protein (TIGR03437 family)
VRIVTTARVVAAAVLLFLATPGLRAQSISIYNAAGGRAGEIAPGSVAALWIQYDYSKPIPETAMPSVSLYTEGSFGAIPLEIMAGIYSPEVYVPLNTPLGRATITVRFGAEYAYSGSVNVVPSSFELFYDNGIPWWARNESTLDPPPLSLSTKPAKPRDVLTLRGNGLGNASVEQITILLNNQRYSASAAIRAADKVGFDQITFQVPEDSALPTGCYVRLRTQIGGKISKPLLLSLSREGAPCQHPYGLTIDDMTRLDEGGTVPIGRIATSSHVARLGDWRFYFDVINQTVLGNDSDFIRVETADASFRQQDGRSIGFEYDWRSYLPPATGCFAGTVAPGGTAVEGPSGEGISVGETLRLLSSSGSSIQLEQPKFPQGPSEAPDAGTIITSRLSSAGYYFRPPVIGPPAATLEGASPVVFTAGELEVQMPGSQTVPAATIRARQPGPVVLTNSSQLMNVDSSRELTVTWDPQNYTDPETINFYVYTIADSGDISYAECYAPARTGRGTIPTGMMASLKPASGSQRAGYFGIVYYSGKPVGEVRSVALTDGTRMPVIFSFTSSAALGVTIQ